jgi:CelD/BcsL family acetyltransferase involved in cellulose biosynthesis
MTTVNKALNQPMPNTASVAATVRVETLESYASYWLPPDSSLVWPSPFELPPWLTAWWTAFGQGWSAYLLSIRVGGRLAGVAPLMRRGAEVRMMGDQDLCDYMDFVVAPRYARAFYRGLLDHLAADGIKRLVLWSVREDASAMSDLRPTAAAWGARVHCKPRGPLFAMPLPASWEEYLQRLSGKERHEIRRKLRRLESAGRIGQRCVRSPAELPPAMATFMKLFRANRSDKAAFMTGPRPGFFRGLTAGLAAADVLRLYFLELDERPIAATLCFEYDDIVYLYNNGYDDAYRALSAGLLGKVLTIRESIHAGCRMYDFLKGDEKYKKRLGGAPVNLYRCQIDWDAKRMVS